MHNALFVKVSQSKSDLTSIELNLVLLEPPLCFEKSVKFSTSDEWHYEEKP